MIDFTDFDDLERTQRLPLMTAELQLDEAIKQERAARVEVAALKRVNQQLANDLAQLRGRAGDSLHATAQAVAPPADPLARTTEEMLFEVCGALRDTLVAVLQECQARHLPLNCGPAADRTLDESCDTLERILSDPAFLASTTPPVASSPPAQATARAEPTARSARLVREPADFDDDDVPTARVLYLEVSRSSASSAASAKS